MTSQFPICPEKNISPLPSSNVFCVRSHPEIFILVLASARNLSRLLNSPKNMPRLRHISMFKDLITASSASGKAAVKFLTAILFCGKRGPIFVNRLPKNWLLLSNPICRDSVMKAIPEINSITCLKVFSITAVPIASIINYFRVQRIILIFWLQIIYGLETALIFCRQKTWLQHPMFCIFRQV